MDAQFREFAVSLSKPLATARGEVTAREGFLVRVSDGEHVGVGEATPLAPWTESRAECRGALEDAVDRLRDDEAALRADLDRNPAARHGVALALADLRATQHDRPLYRLLGRRSDREWVPVNATVGDAAPAETAAAAARAVEQGYGTAREGEGYGLFVAERVARAHGWDIAAGESEAGGARFEVHTG